MKHTLCPTCKKPLTKFGDFLMCPKHGQISEKPKPIAPLRIFLSYGHDANEKLVRLIRKDLEKRGHDVWFDKSEIKFGDDWRQSITEGVFNSDQVLSFLSKHSTRDPGVCRDEIAIALGVKGGNIKTILVEDEKKVELPVNIGHVQWLDMHDWKEKFAVGGEEWKAWYESKLNEIISVVESEESRRFAGEIDELKEYLRPIDSNARISVLLNKGFFGRKWLFEAFENWRNDRSQNSRLFWISGDPGVGKSAFAAQLMHTRGDVVIAAQFVEWDKPDHRDPKRVIKSIAFQLATRLPDYRKFLLMLPELNDLTGKNASELFDYLLANPLDIAIKGGRERYLIVIDALDEAGETYSNPLVELLARNVQSLPEWLGIVVTGRPESAVKTPLQGLNPFILDTGTDDNIMDIRDYLSYYLAGQLKDRSDSDQILDQIIDKSEGVFLYAEHFCEDVHQGHISLDKPEEFPQGLGGVYFDYFKRQFPDLDKYRKEIRPALRAILAAREPLPIEILKSLFDWEDEELHDFIRTLGSLFRVTTENDIKTIKPYHKSLADWLEDEARTGVYYVSVMEGHRLLSKYCLSHLESIDIKQARNSISGYSTRSLLLHLSASHDWSTLTYCISNPELFELIWPGAYTLQSHFSHCHWNVFCHLHPNAIGLITDLENGHFTAQSEAIEPRQLVAAINESERDVVMWKMAYAFAERVRELQVSIFAFEKQYGQHNNTAHDYLHEHYPKAFNAYRNLMYGFVWLARLPAEYALLAYDLNLENTPKLSVFLDTYRPIHTYLWYLEGFAMSWRWSGQLESEAYVAYDPWKQLIEYRKGA